MAMSLSRFTTHLAALMASHLLVEADLAVNHYSMVPSGRFGFNLEIFCKHSDDRLDMFQAAVPCPVIASG